MILDMNKIDVQCVGLKLKAVQDFKCIDTNWNQPKEIEIKAGDIVEYVGGGSSAGNVTFIHNAKRVFINDIGCYSKYPYTHGHIDTDYLKPINWSESLLNCVKGKV